MLVLVGSAPLLCWVTPRKEEEPRVKPGLVRLMAMTSSAMGTVSSRSNKAVYLRAMPWWSKHFDLVRDTCHTLRHGVQPINVDAGRPAEGSTC